jgi:hypothetical protein
MFPTKFCPQCGEKIKQPRLSSFAFTVFCSGCKKQARFTRFVPVAMVISLTIGSFLIGRLTTPRQQFQFIGVPIDLQNVPGPTAGDPAQASANTAGASAMEQTTSSSAEARCGAPTKAGRPCRRKVRGGGACYQHDDNFKASSRPAQ